MRIGTAPVLFTLALVTAAQSASGWGREAHEIICEIAFQELEPAARRQVIELLRGDTPRYRIFARACSYADDSNEDQRDRRIEHYVNVPRTWTSIARAECVTADRCLFTAIRDDTRRLAGADTSLARRRRALKYLGHWVGDLHQPLHVSFADDRGGNEILLTEKIGCAANLHAVWDTCIPRDIMGDEGFQRNAKGLAHTLHGEISDAERAAWWGNGVDPVRWANESLAIARRPDVQYCVLDAGGTRCRYSERDSVYDPRRRASTRRIRLTGRYEDARRGDVRTRFKQAGVRLGKMLNQLLAE